jgi:antirestriction protein ArdC
MSRQDRSIRAGPNRSSLYDEITTKIVAELKAGRMPWVQPLGTVAVKAPLAMPRNATTGRGYLGVNVFILWGAIIENGFPGQSWFRQALSLGGNVHKGECGRPSFKPTPSFRTTRRGGRARQAKKPKRSHS